MRFLCRACGSCKPCLCCICVYVTDLDLFIFVFGYQVKEKLGIIFCVSGLCFKCFYIIFHIFTLKLLTRLSLIAINLFIFISHL